jgi:hypothetical protein
MLGPIQEPQGKAFSGVEKQSGQAAAHQAVLLPRSWTWIEEAPTDHLLSR